MSHNYKNLCQALHNAAAYASTAEVHLAADQKRRCGSVSLYVFINNQAITQAIVYSTYTHAMPSLCALAAAGSQLANFPICMQAVCMSIMPRPSW